MSKTKTKNKIEETILKDKFACQPIYKTDLISFRNAYSPQKVVTTTCSSSETEQSHKDSCDINKIFHASNHSPELLIPENPPTFGDFSNGSDFTEMQNRVADAVSGFENLPSETREFFDHKPANLVEFMNDPHNAQDAINMGLIELEPESLEKYLTPEEEAPQTDQKNAKNEPNSETA